jgi:tape measure domain-containing protein
MAAASIVIDLLMKTSSFQTDTERAGRALQKLSKQSKDSASAIASEFKRVQDAITKAGMTLSQQKLFDLKQMGASQQQLVAYARNLEELDRKTKSLSASNASLASSFKGIALAAGTGFGFSTITSFTDSYIKLTAQLKNASQGNYDFGRSMADVERISKVAQSDIESTATFYARLANATRDAGTSQKQLAQVTETISLALKNNAATAQETSSVLVQLSQAFGAGRLNGQEFVSAMENAPPLMRALAESMGVPFGALKDLAAQGKVTIDELIKAFTNQKFLDALRNQAKEIRTISGGYSEITSQLKLFVGETEQANGSLSLYAKTLGLVASAIEKFRKAGSFDIGLAQLVPGAQALSVFKSAGSLGQANPAQSRSGKIRFNPPAATPAAAITPALPKIPQITIPKIPPEVAKLARDTQTIADNVTVTNQQWEHLSELQANSEGFNLKELEESSRRLTDDQEDFKKRSYDAWVSLLEPAQRLELQIAAVRAETERLGLSQDFADPIVEQMIKAEEKAKNTTKELSDIGRDLGLTFSSAFEDAIAGAKSFSEILRGLEQDIIRIITRKLVTEPLAQGVTNLVSGFDFKSLFPSFDVGTPYVQKDMLANVHKGERILTAAENRAFSSGSMGGTVVNQYIQTPDANSFRKSQAQIMADMQRALNKGRRVT